MPPLDLAQAVHARRLAGTLALATPLLAGCGAREPAPPPLSALLITLDTTRADALGCYGGPPGLTPALDALAAESVRYSQARTVVPVTLPAHASMLTGLVPPRHGVRDNAPAALVPEAMTLAELAAAAGYQTAGLVAASPLDQAWGIAQGFQTWSQPEGGSAPEARRMAERPATAVVDEAVAWLDARDRSRPFLLWVHLFEPHQPYAPPPRFLERAGGSAYHGEVAAMDAEVGRLIARLRDEELLGSTAVLVIGDHGEGLGDHGEPTHGYFVWDTTLRVPFLLRHPDGRRAGEVSDETVSVVDVFPTLCGALGLEPPADLDGVSLWAGHVDAQREVYFEALSGWARFGWSPQAGIADASGKYVHSSRPVFWHSREEPGEERDHLAELGEGVARYVEALRRTLSRPALARGLARGEAPLAELARLGYAADRSGLVQWPDPLMPSSRPAPLDRVAEAAEYLEAREQLGSAAPGAPRYDEAMERLEALTRANPLNLAALDELGAGWIARREWVRAAEVLERRAALPPPRISTHKGLLLCYLELGRELEALEQELRTLELLLQIAVQSGDLEQAQALEQVRAHEAAELTHRRARQAMGDR
jgi:arylsulfatase A-like enzyme